MPPSLVGPSNSACPVRHSSVSSASSSSSARLWLSSENDWILTQALTHELSSGKAPSSSSNSSSSQSLRASSSSASEAMVQPPVSGLLPQLASFDGFLPCQKQSFLHKETLTPFSSNAASPISVTKEKPDSPPMVGMDSFGANQQHSTIGKNSYGNNSYGNDSFAIRDNHGTIANGTTGGRSDSHGAMANGTIPRDNNLGLQRFANYQHQHQHRLRPPPSTEGFVNQSIDNTNSTSLRSASDDVNNTNGSSKSAIALSAQASAGAANAKAGKRRSRANKKAPIAVLSADTVNFRAMVQQLTGIPSAPPMQQNYGSHMWGASGGVPLLKPNPTRPAFNGTLNLPTLDTSASFLGSKPTPLKAPLQDISFLQRCPPLGANFGSELGHNEGIDSNNNIQGNIPFDFKQSFAPNAIHYTTSPSMVSSSLQSFTSGAPSMPTSTTSGTSLWDQLNAGESRGHYISNNDSLKQGSQQQQASLDSFLFMDDIFAKSPSSINMVDAWFALDGSLQNNSPKLEIARMA